MHMQCILILICRLAASKETQHIQLSIVHRYIEVTLGN